MKNLRINKEYKISTKSLKVVRNTIIGAMALVTPLFSSCSSKGVNEREVTSYVVSIDEINKGDDSVVLFNIGNYDIKGKSNLRDIKKANKKGVPCGIIINTMASNKSEIYNDVEYVKYIIENSDIDCPVYLNIDLLTSNNMLRVDEMLVLISTFVSKLTENKILVGICGSEANIKKLIDNDINHILNAYDIFLTNNDSELKLESSVSSMIKIDENGNYRTYENFENICRTKNLNNSSNFLCDRVHTVKEGETLADIAFSYGLSVNDLLDYNNFTQKDNPKLLRIPSVVSSINNNLIEFTKKSEGDFALGLDLSACDSRVDWSLLSERYDFIILKATWHTNIADKFEEYSGECSYRDIPYGVYCANYISNLNVKGYEKTENEMKNAQKEQIEVILKSISNKNIVLPVFLDFEDFDGNDSFASKYNADQCVAMLDVWYETLTKTGYTPGIYCNMTHLKKLKYAYDNKYGEDSLEKNFKLWIAGDLVKNFGYTSPVDYNDTKKILKEIDDDIFNIENTYACAIQPWGCGINFGASNSDGFVDVNIAQMDSLFPNVEIEKIDDDYDLDLVKTKEPNQQSMNVYILRNKYGKYIIYSLVTLSCCALGYISRCIIEKEESKKKSKKIVKTK